MQTKMKMIIAAAVAVVVLAVGAVLIFNKPAPAVVEEPVATVEVTPEVAPTEAPVE